MTTNLFVIANVKQLRTGGSFRIFLPFFRTSWGVLVSQIQQFLTVSTIGLSLARFWRAFGNSGGRGGLNHPNLPSVRHCALPSLKNTEYTAECPPEPVQTFRRRNRCPEPTRSRNPDRPSHRLDTVLNSANPTRKETSGIQICTKMSDVTMQRTILGFFL